MHEDQWSVAVGIKWNVFDGGAARHRGSAVELQAAALSEQRDELALAIGLQVRQAWLDVQETRKRICVTESDIHPGRGKLARSARPLCERPYSPYGGIGS